MKKEMDAKNKDEVLSSIVELLRNDLGYSENFSNTAISLIKDAHQNGVVHIFEDYLIIKLSMGDWLKYQVELENLRYQISAKFCLVQNSKFTTVNIQLIKRNINAHKVDITEGYMKDKITDIVGYINTDPFKQHAERLLKSLEINDYPAAVTNARAAAESFTKHLTGKRKVDNNVDHKTLLKSVMRQLQISGAGSESNVDDITNTIIENLDNNLFQLSKLRNDHGIDHGKGSEYISYIQKHHAKLAVGTAILFMDFLVAAKNSPH